MEIAAPVAVAQAAQAAIAVDPGPAADLLRIAAAPAAAIGVLVTVVETAAVLT